MQLEASVRATSGITGHCQFCGKMLTIKRIGDKLYLNCYGSSARMVTEQNRQNIATAYEEMGLLLRMMNQFDEAQVAYQKAESIANGLLEGAPSNREYLILRSLILFRQAEAFHAQGGHRDQARTLYQQSQAIDRQFNQTQDSQLARELLAELG